MLTSKYTYQYPEWLHRAAAGASLFGAVAWHAECNPVTPLLLALPGPQPLLRLRPAWCACCTCRMARAALGAGAGPPEDCGEGPARPSPVPS